MLKIQVIIGSTRENRFSEKPANYIFSELKKQKDVEPELIDLKDWPLPFFDEPISPSMSKGKYNNPLGRKWADKVAEADGYIIIAPEYNHGYPAVLKNALDWVFNEWHKKPIGFVSYGSVGGARSVEQLKQVAIELKLVPIRQAIHLSSDIYMAALGAEGAELDKVFKSLRDGPRGDVVGAFFEELLDLADNLKSLRRP